ncbi:MAG: hypothetical protein IMF11_20225 [Proteobacteria bacterium]|nr:hypothetical protein [Pseudomonadota bacterium]
MARKYNLTRFSPTQVGKVNNKGSMERCPTGEYVGYYTAVARIEARDEKIASLEKRLEVINDLARKVLKT